MTRALSPARRSRGIRNTPLRALALALALAAGARDAGAQRAISWDCNTHGWTDFGYAVALSGDGDGDGLPDVMIGAPRHTLTSGCHCERAGAVYFPGVPGFVEGGAAGDRFGCALAGGLELDGDGVLDTIVGAMGDDDVAPGCGSVAALAGLGRTELYRVFGSARGDELGASVALLGDVDGDGRDDFVAGAPQVPAGGSGYVRVYSGGDGGELYTVTGALPGDAFGFAVCGVSDVDGDGLGDFAVGAPGALAAGEPRGVVSVHSGVDGSNILVLEGEEAGRALRRGPRGRHRSRSRRAGRAGRRRAARSRSSRRRADLRTARRARGRASRR